MRNDENGLNTTFKIKTQMTHKNHIHSASFDGFYMYTVKEQDPDILYSLYFKTESEVDFIGTYAPWEIIKAKPYDAYSFKEKLTFLYLRHKIVAQVEGKSDISQGNHFNHPAWDEEGVGYSPSLEEFLDKKLDELLIERGEHPSRVRNPIYGEERDLAKRLVSLLTPHSKK